MSEQQELVTEYQTSALIYIQNTLKLLKSIEESKNIFKTELRNLGISRKYIRKGEKLKKVIKLFLSIRAELYEYVKSAKKHKIETSGFITIIHLAIKEISLAILTVKKLRLTLK